MNPVVHLPRRKVFQRPPPSRYEAPTLEERTAADDLLRKAQAIHRLVSASFATSAVMSTAPRLIAEAEAALMELKVLIG